MLVEIDDRDDELALASPALVELRWVHRGDALRGPQSPLVAALRGFDLTDDGETFVWAAGEAGTMRAIRRYLRDTLALGRNAFQVQGYWREHLTEEQSIAADWEAVSAAKAAGKSESELEDARVY